MFYSTDEAKKFDNKRKRQEIAVEARLLKQAGNVSPIGGYDKVLQATLADHVERIHADGVLYAAPRTCLSLQSLDEALSEPLAKRARVFSIERRPLKKRSRICRTSWIRMQLMVAVLLPTRPVAVLCPVT